MRIDKRLHLVVPIYADEDDGGAIVAYVHSTPLSEETVDIYFDVLGKTCTAIFSQGYGMVSGQGHAMRILKRIAIEAGAWTDDARGRVGVERGLIEEIRRLTMVTTLDKTGRWESLPLAVAVQRSVITAQDQREVENAIVFFIAAYATLPRAQRRMLLEAAAELWGAQLTSSPFTEWTASLRTSTPAENTGENPPAVATAAPARATAIAGGRPRSVPV